LWDIFTDSLARRSSASSACLKLFQIKKCGGVPEDRRLAVCLLVVHVRELRHKVLVRLQRILYSESNILATLLPGMIGHRFAAFPRLDGGDENSVWEFKRVSGKLRNYQAAVAFHGKAELEEAMTLSPSSGCPVDDICSLPILVSRLRSLVGGPSICG
jgi:hypothetical protein